MSTPQANTSTAPEESVPDAHSNTASPGGEQTNLSSPGQASPSPVVENPPEHSSPAAVVSAVRTAPTQPTLSWFDPAVPHSHPELPAEYAAEGSTPAVVRPRVVSATLQVPTATYGGRGRGGGHYPDSEVAWHARELVRKINVKQRLDPTIKIVNDELEKATKRGETIAWTQKIASTLEVLVGALITALGAALRGPSTNIAITILGVTSTLVAWYLSRTRDSNEPQKSRDRARDLGHLLREVEVFILDHGHEPGNMWGDRINGFRLTLENILGIETSTDPNSMADSNTSRGRARRGSDSGASSNGNGNRHGSAVWPQRR